MGTGYGRGCLQEEVGKSCSLLISPSTHVMTCCAYCGPEQLIGVFVRTSAQRYSKPEGKPWPAATSSMPISLMMSQIRLISLKKSTANESCQSRMTMSKQGGLTVGSEPFVEVLSFRQLHRACQPSARRTENTRAAYLTNRRSRVFSWYRS